MGVVSPGSLSPTNSRLSHELETYGRPQDLESNVSREWNQSRNLNLSQTEQAHGALWVKTRFFGGSSSTGRPRRCWGQSQRYVFVKHPPSYFLRDRSHGVSLYSSHTLVLNLVRMSHMSTRARARARTHTRTHTHAHTHTHTHTHVHVCVYIYVYMCTYTYACQVEGGINGRRIHVCHMRGRILMHVRLKVV
jgi:hypothetical protein